MLIGGVGGVAIPDSVGLNFPAVAGAPASSPSQSTSFYYDRRGIRTVNSFSVVTLMASVDLLPLPTDAALFDVIAPHRNLPAPVSLSSRRRLWKARPGEDWCSRGVRAINDLAGLSASGSGLVASENQSVCLQRVFSRYRECAKEIGSVQPQRAFRELLKLKSGRRNRWQHRRLSTRPREASAVHWRTA